MDNSMPEQTSLTIRRNIEDLARLILKIETVPTALVTKCSRLIRFDSYDSLSQHNKAIRLKLREKIILNEETSSSAVNLAKFEQECDALRRLNPSLLASFLAIYEPLAFSTINDTSNTSKGMILPSVYDGNRQVASTKIITDATTSVVLPETLQQAFMIDKASENLINNSGLFWISRDIEIKILIDLLFIFQGINGKYIKYDPRSESYALDPTMKANIPQPVREIILCLCEVGWLFEKISKYTIKVESSEAIGLISQAFAFSLQEELHDYYRLLAVLEQELHRLSSESSTKSTDLASGKGTSGLTLLRLRAWMQEPLERMCLMARLVDGANVLSGGALASRLHGHGRHGDKFISIFVQRIMDHVCVPLYNMITRWILYGDLQDPYEEFFVGMNRMISTPSNLTPNVWLDTYFLRHGMLPTFLPLSLALRILVIGKTINFIRLCMSTIPKKVEKITILPNTEYKPRNQRAQVTLQQTTEDNRESGTTQSKPEGDLSTWLLSSIGKDVEASLQGLRYGGELELVEVVQKIGHLTDTRLMRLIEERYHLSMHLLALKKYLLLGQGDFVTCLMDTIGPELRKRANQLYRHNLTGMLEGALRSSNAQYDPSDILERIGVRLLESTPGDTGWEVFSLDYKIDMPINAVVHGDAISKYRIAFHMFWRLKRVEWSLSASWKQMMTFTHTRGEILLPQLRYVIHRCTLNRGRMLHVVNNLCAFIMFEVLETAWAKLQENLQRSKCLDDVILCHDKYLDEILDRALLSPQHEKLNLQIQQLLQSILRFCALEESLVADAMAAIARKRGSLDLNTTRAILNDRSLAIDTDTVDGVPTFMITRLDDAAVDFNARFDDIMTTLKEQSEQASDLLRYLTFRLDFNEYHASSQQKVKALQSSSTSIYTVPQLGSFLK